MSLLQSCSALINQSDNSLPSDKSEAKDAIADSDNSKDESINSKETVDNKSETLYSMERPINGKKPEPFGISNFLCNYNDIATYKLSEELASKLEMHKKETKGFSNLRNFPIMEGITVDGTNYDLCGYEVNLCISIDTLVIADESMQRQLAKDFIHAIDESIEDVYIDNELDKMYQFGKFTTYFNEIFKVEGDTKLSENKLLLFVKYNPKTTYNWGYDEFIKQKSPR